MSCKLLEYLENNYCRAACIVPRNYEYNGEKFICTECDVSCLECEFSSITCTKCYSDKVLDKEKQK